MARMRWNPITGRYEAVGGGSETDVPAPFGQPALSAGTDIVNEQTRGATVKRTPRTQTAKTAPSTTTTVPSTSTTVPSTSTTVPTGKKGGAKTKTGGKVTGGTARTWESPVAYSGAGSDLVGGAIDEALKQGDVAGLTQLLTLLGMGSGGGGGGGATATQKAEEQKRLRNRKVAGELTRRANENYNVDTANVNKYYADQQAAGLAAIQKAMEEYRATLPSPTAFENVPLSALPQTQQGLTQELLRQGATAQTAEAQMASDAAMAQRIADISSRGASDIQGANRAFFDALARAGAGGQAASLASFTQNIAALKAQEDARLRQNQQDLILEALKLRYGG